MTTLYLAYGSNTNIAQMKQRCPTAKAKRIVYLNNSRLVFRRVLDVEYAEGKKTPCVLWQLTDADEHSLDRYEGVHTGKYAKEYISLDDGDLALVYVMLKGAIEPPTADYYNRVLAGYQQFNISPRYLEKAKARSLKVDQKPKFVTTRTTTKLAKEPRDVTMARKQNRTRITNLNDYLAERRASGRSY